MSVRVVSVLVGVSVIGSLALFDVYRRGENAARETARALACFPLELPEPAVYRITKTLTRQVVSEKFPSTATVHDTYFTKLTLAHGRASRSEKCASLEQALASTTETKVEELVQAKDGVRFADTGLLLCPDVAPLAPVTFALTFGLTRDGDGFFGWPLIEVIGLTDPENALFGELSPQSGKTAEFVKPEADRQTLFNVQREETVRFIQSPGEVVTLSGQLVSTIKLSYSGHLTRANSFHEIAGAVWLAPGRGVIKEQREVRFTLYARDLFDEKHGTYARPHGDHVQYEAAVTKVLAGQR